MKRIFEIGIVCIVGLLLAGCWSFPGHRVYKVESCANDECGLLMKDSELALVKETKGDNWSLLHHKPTATERAFSEVCTGTVDDDKFACDFCDGPAPDIVIKKANSSSCSNHADCVRIEMSGGIGCPDGGQVIGGKN
jgi:hypothetical protein